jgi:hypothetical protein
MQERSVQFDIALSYTSLSRCDAELIKAWCSPFLTIYDYSDQFERNFGQSVERISNDIYASLPTIILLDQAWWERPITQLECQILLGNPHPKLVFDYRSIGFARLEEKGVPAIARGEFTPGGELQRQSVTSYLHDLSLI